jgi:methionyl-tRNA formyltransferase
MARGSVVPAAQDAAAASYAPRLKKEDGRVRWSDPATAIERRIRGFQPWPGAFATWDGRGLKLLRARVEPPRDGGPGSVLAVDAAGLVVACGEASSLRLLEVQPESRGAMAAAAFAAGARVRPGQRFD